MSMMNTSKVAIDSRAYLTVTGEDLGRVLNCLDDIKEYALANASMDANKPDHPPTTTFKFPLPLCMSVEIHTCD